MFLKLFFALLLVISGVSSAIPGILETPAFCSPEILERRLASHDAQMSWLVREKDYFRAICFTYDAQSRSVRLDCLVGSDFVPALPAICPHAERLVCNDSLPAILQVADVVSLVRNKKILFYTGAGISAGRIPTMAEIFRATGMSVLFEKPRDHVKIDNFFERVVADSRSIKSYMAQFFHACWYAEPTAAHCALTAIAERKNWGIATENLDLLHQRTGLDVVTRGYLGNISDAEIGALDYIITVGLASDESGFLYRCKMVKPDLKIIAFDFVQPAYLSSMDYLVLGDAQVTVPQLSYLFGLS